MQSVAAYISKKKEIFLLVLVFILALFLRLLHMLLRDGYMDFDEAFYLLLARNLVEGKGYTLNGLPHLSFSPLLPLFLAAYRLILGTFAGATKIVAIFFGAALIWPMYLLNKEWFGRRCAFYAATTAALLIQLMTFVPFKLPSRKMLYVASEPLYLFLIYWSLYVAWAGFKKGKLWFWALSGGILGAAFLARSEAVLVFFSLEGLLAICLFSRKYSKWKTLAALGLMGGSFFLLFFPFTLRTLYYTGSWTVSVKMKGGVESRIRWTKDILLHNRWDRVLNSVEALDESGTEMENILWGVKKDVKYESSQGGLIIDNLKSLIRHLPTSIHLYRKGLMWVLFPLYLWPLAALGFILSLVKGDFCKLKKPEPQNLVQKVPRHHFFLRVGFALCLIGPSLVLAGFFYLTPRYHLFIVPLLVSWAGLGLCWTEEKWAKVMQKIRVKGLASWCTRWLKFLPPILVFSVLLYSNLLPAVQMGQKEKRELLVAEARACAQAGSFIERKGGKGVIFMSHHPQIGVLSNCDWRVLPRAPIDKVLNYARLKKARFLVFFVADVPDAPGSLPPYLPLRKITYTDHRYGEAALLIYEVKGPRLAGYFSCP